MTRPARRRVPTLRRASAACKRSWPCLVSSSLLLTLLAACAETPVQTGAAIPVVQEAAKYRAHARSYYAPPGPPDDPWGPYIEEASKKFDVPDTWVRAVIGRESGGQQFAADGTLITSGAGAMGLMQLMAPTYDELRAQYSLGDDAFEPHDNIMAGTAYIRQMYDIYGAPGFLAAYNTGPGRLDDFLTRNRPLPRETRQYVAIIGPQIAGIWPTSRSQADLLVAARSGSDVRYASAQSADQTHSVRLAWTRRHDLQQTDDQPVQVAEAPAGSGDAAPSYIRNWHSLPAAASGGDATGSGGVTGIVMPVQTASAAPAPAGGAGSVSAAWAARGVQDAPGVPAPGVPAPGAPALSFASAAPQRNWTLAPTETQHADAVEPGLPEAPVRLAAAEMPAPRRPRFQLVRPAMAEPAPLLREAGHSGGARNWSVQVGAFGTQAQANQAAGAAQSRAPSLSGARAEIAGIRQGRGGRVYRARLTGLSRGDALQACQRLARGRGDCMVVSPDARS